MLFFLVVAGGLWALGAVMQAPHSARWMMIGLLYLAILAAAIIFPEGHPIHAVLGGTTGEWLVLGGLVAVVWAYTRGIARLRARVRPENRGSDASGPQKPPSAAEIERNSRHILLREIGGPGQTRLRGAKVLVVGAGGLGAPVIQYLGAAGIGTLGIIDDDVVEASNLQRQVIHTDDRLGMPKVFSAERAVQAQNPHVAVRPYNRRLTADIAGDLFAEFDLVLDGTDDTATRYLVNKTVQSLDLPVVFGALSQWEGQVAVFLPGGPCYRCLFPEPSAPGVAPTCAEGGVLGPLPGVVGSMMAVEAVKLITGAGEPLKDLLIYDALWGETRSIRISKDPDCPDCASRG